MSLTTSFNGLLRGLIRRFPGLAAAITGSGNGAIGRRVLAARLAVAAERDDVDTLNALHKTMWAGDRGRDFNAQPADERLKFFKQHYAGPFTEIVAGLLSQSDNRPVRVIDLGCGDGQVLGYLSEQFDLPEAIGLDLNPEAIASATARYGARSGLNFVCADMREALPEYLTPGCLVMTNAGVLEYFASQDVDAIFSQFAKHDGLNVLLVEPLADGFEMGPEDNRASVVFGRENSFSHNYVGKLNKAGFETHRVHEIPLANFPRLAVIWASIRRAI